MQFASLVVPVAAPAAAVKALRLQHINFQQPEQHQQELALQAAQHGQGQGQRQHLQWPASLAELMPHLEALHVSSQ